MPRTVKRKASPIPSDFRGGKTYIGIDNGVSGSIGIILPNGVPYFYKVPIRKCLNYQKKANYISRIDVVALERILKNRPNAIAILERPMVNPQRFAATVSAVRALEALEIVLERLEIPYRFIDSKEWQSVLLPKGIKGSDKLKEASLQVGSRLYPQFKSKFKKDADGMLIAECGRRERW